MFCGALPVTCFMGPLFRARREELGLTLKELSARCGLSPRRLATIEGGKNDFRADIPFILGKAMDFCAIAYWQKAERMQDRAFPHLRLARKRIQKKFQKLQAVRAKASKS